MQFFSFYLNLCHESSDPTSPKEPETNKQTNRNTQGVSFLCPHNSASATNKQLLNTQCQLFQSQGLGHRNSKVAATSENVTL